MFNDGHASYFLSSEAGVPFLFIHMIMLKYWKGKQGHGEVRIEPEIKLVHFMKFEIVK